MHDPTMDQSLFERATLRRVWHTDEWFYSVVDVIAILTESSNPRNYWKVLKGRLHDEGFDATLNQIVPLKLQAADKRFRLTDTANRMTLLRILQSVPSPRAEPFRQWLAEVGDERINDIEHPEAAIERVQAAYRRKGYTEAWIEVRIRNDLLRNELTDEWRERGAQEGRDYAILTNEISQGTFGLAIQAHKAYKVLPKGANLRDHMTPMELALISLGEATAITLHRTRDSHGFPHLHRDAHDAGAVGARARQDVEQLTGESAVSPDNHLALQQASRHVPHPSASSTNDATQPQKQGDNAREAPQQLSLLNE